MNPDPSARIRRSLTLAGLGLLLASAAATYLVIDLTSQVRDLERLAAFMARVTGTTDAIFPAVEEVGTRRASWLASISLVIGGVFTLSNLILAWRQESRHSAEHKLKLQQLEAEVARLRAAAERDPTET